MTSLTDSQNDNENAVHKTEGEKETGTTGSNMSPDEIAIEEFCVIVAWIYLLSLTEEAEAVNEEEE